jgi:hypothetical protein
VASLRPGLSGWTRAQVTTADNRAGRLAPRRGAGVQQVAGFTLAE